MGHYALVDYGVVKQVIVAEQDFIDTYTHDSPGMFIKTSYNTYGGQHPDGTPLRYNYAGIGFIYDSEADAFYEPQPYPSWELNTSTYLWEAPVAEPSNGEMHRWNEETTSWDAV